MIFFLQFVLREAMRALSRNKHRSALTVLGVTIGIAAVICVIAIGDAGSAQIEQQLQNLGDNLILVEAGGRSVNGIRTGSRTTKTLVVADARAILEAIPLIKGVSPQVDDFAQVVYGGKNWNTQYFGQSPEYLQIRHWKVLQGSSFTWDDVDHAADVCVLGNTVREQLFGMEDPLDKIIRIKTIPCRVIGLLKPKGQSPTGKDQDDIVVMPYTTVQKKIAGISWLYDIVCSATSSDAVVPATLQMASLLRDRHHIRPGQNDDFSIRSPSDLVEVQLETSRTFATFLICIASISLLVGGIGIMNVMLVSVTERTREIGVRLAVGATEAAVQAQFIGEAVILSLFGGTIGMLVGIAGVFTVGYLLGWSMIFSVKGILIAFGFSVAVGIFFGFYPAAKASRLDPIQALHFER